MDLNEDELETLDLADRYDEDIHTYTTLRWKDYALLYAVCAIVLTFIAWASFFTVDELARGIGKVIPSSEVQIIQNLEGGIIDKFYVSEGDVVEQNQLLVRISNVQADSEYQANLKRYQSLQAELIRLDAETKGVTPEFPADLVQAAPDAVLLETAN